MAPSTLSFQPPIPVEPYAAGSTSVRSGSPDWVLLHKAARISDLHNTTTVVSKTADGQAVEVSFWLVDPPGVSYFSVNCPGLKEDGFAFEPYVVCAEAALVLFCVTFNLPRGAYDPKNYPPRKAIHYFVYRAGPGKPALHLLPPPVVGTVSPKQLGLVPCGGDLSEHYAVAYLGFDDETEDWQFDVRVFSSQTQAWSRKVPLVRCNWESYAEHVTLKQVKVGRSSVGWVDLLVGILLLSHIFNDNPVIEYIQYPPESSSPENDSYRAPEYFRDVTCCDDLIKFVDIKYLGPESSPYQVWEATTWNMKISDNLWRKRLTVHVDSISVDQSYLSVLPELWDDKTQKLQLKKLSFHAPTLSIHDDDFLYVAYKVNDEDDKAWVITVDMKQSAVEAVAAFPAPEQFLPPKYYPCAFPKYLSRTPGTDITNSMHKYFKMMHAKKCALEVESAQGWLREIDGSLESGRSSIIYLRLLQCSPVPSLRFSIPAVVEYASCNGQGKAKAASKAVDVCLRALEDLNLLLRNSLSDPSISTGAIRSKINLTLQALDNVLRIASPAVMAFDHSNTKDKCDKLQQARSSGKKKRRKKHNRLQRRNNLKRLLSFVLPKMCFIMVCFSLMYIWFVIFLNVEL